MVTSMLKGSPSAMYVKSPMKTLPVGELSVKTLTMYLRKDQGRKTHRSNR
jgi:hypothetical protein